MFLTSVVLRAFNLPVKKDSISSNGDCHDLGTGGHISTEHYNQSGWKWQTDDLKDKFCISGHYSNLIKVKKTYPDIKVVLISTDDVDRRSMVELRFYKTLNSTELSLVSYEYNKFIKRFNITDWPSIDEIVNQPKLLEQIKDSYIKYDTQWYDEWVNSIDLGLVDIVVPFKSVFGLNNISLKSVLEEKLSINLDASVSQYIKNYQEKNMEYITL